MANDNLDLFTHPSAPKFRAKIKPENRAKMDAWFSKSSKQMIAKFQSGRHKGCNATLETMMGNHAYGPTGLTAAVALGRLALVRKVAEASLAETGFWALAWRIASEKDGLHIWPVDPEPECIEQTEECTA